MNIEKFKEKIEKKIEEIENLVYKEMKDTGITEELSQQVCIQHWLGKLSHTVNGTIQEDLK